MVYAIDKVQYPAEAVENREWEKAGVYEVEMSLYYDDELCEGTEGKGRQEYLFSEKFADW